MLKNKEFLEIEIEKGKIKFQNDIFSNHLSKELNMKTIIETILIDLKKNKNFLNYSKKELSKFIKIVLKSKFEKNNLKEREAILIKIIDLVK